RQDAIHRYIVRFHRDLTDDLLVKSDPAGFPAHNRQQLVVKSFAPAQSAAMQVEGYSRYQDEVQRVNRHRGAMLGRLAKAELAGLEVRAWIANFAGDIKVAFRDEPWQSNGLAARQSVGDQRPQVQFPGERGVKQD